jgi:ATP-dependent exoDNAse (exonuclease V) beta subunit
MTAIDPRSPSARVVTAPAGSGKTTLLLHHYLRHLRTTPIERIVAITFTRKAATELVDRLATILRAVVAPASAPPDWARLEALYRDVLPSPETARAALASLDAAPVSTVDAFTLSLVQEFLLDARLALSDGRDTWVDGPVASGTDTGVFYEAAARARLEALGAGARTLVRELGIGPSIAEVARLARAGIGGVPSADALLRALGKALAPAVKEDRDAWLAVKAKLPQPALDAIGAWVAKPKARPPAALLAWLARAGGVLAEARDAAIATAFRELGIVADAGALWERPDALKEWTDDDALDRADGLRSALSAVASEVRDDALAALARAGALGYDELLAVATRLCEAPPQALATRFDVLMVDELQDTNPGQLAFYRAFARMRRDPPIASFFVGDARQSIFRFRAADPYGWRTLVEEADRVGTRADLEVNYRSTRRLVALQQAVFGTLAGTTPGVDPLPRLQPAERAEDGLLRDASPPVAIIDGPEVEADLDPAALALFAARIAEQWQTHPDETAAVLVRSWDAGYWAVDALREHGVEAQLTGDRALLGSRVAIDLRVFLRALADPADDVATAAVLKHPSIGVTDRGLLLLRAGGSLARLFAPEVDLAAVDAADRVALQRALPILRAARARLGRGPTADLLEQLATELYWRALVAAGPEGERLVGVAQLDVLLDVVRGVEAERVDPQAVIAALTPDEGGGADLPVVRMAQDRRVVTVTTVFAAKGLEFDHVLLTEMHKPARPALENGGVALLGRPGGKPLLGVRIDPAGGLTPSPDPLGVIARCADQAEALAEGLRLFYVGFTRAKRSVTFALKKKRKGTHAEALRIAFRAAADDPRHAGSIRFASPDEIEVRDATRPVRARTGRVAELAACWAPREGWALARPSGARELLDGSGVVEAFLARARIVTGPAAPPVPEVPGLEDVPEIVWGDVVHGWLERWHFAGTPEVTAAVRYLDERWGLADARIAEWLVALGLGVRDGLPGFAELLGRARAIRFEWPLVGVEPGVVWTGRADLVLELPDDEVVILDFKAGSHAATADEIPGVREYAPQLEAYRRMLEAAGKRVVETGLVYVRGVSWVRA